MMNRDKQIEEMELTDVDILANDINEHCIDLSQTYCGGTSCTSCLGHALTEKGYRKSTEVAREIFEEIEQKIDTLIKLNLHKKDELIYEGFFCCEMLSTLKNQIIVMQGIAELIAKLKKKYTESEKD